MKIHKILCLMVLCLILSCSNDTDDSNNYSDSILGSWKLIKTVKSCSSGSNKTLSLNECQEKSTIIFNQDNTLIIKDETKINNECFTRTITGKWKIEQNNLTITFTGLDSPIPDDEVESPTHTELRIKDNILRVGYYNTDNTNFCNDGTLVSFSYNEFSK